MASAPPSRAAARVRLWDGARPSSSRAFASLVLAGAGALSGALMLVALGRRPFWFDEIVSVEAAQLPAGRLARYLAETEVNMSLYHALLHVWLRLGSGEAFARSLSVLFALATLPVLYVLACRLFGTRTAVIAVVLMAANVAFVAHAREARSYALTVLLITAASLFLVTAVQDGRRRDWAAYAVLAALAVYAHLLASLAVAAQAGSLVASRRRIRARPAVSAVAVLGVLVSPLAVSLALDWQGRQIDWLERAPARQLPGLLLWLAGSRPLAALYGAAAVGALVAAYLSRRRLGGHGGVWRYAFVLAWLALPPLAAFVISFVQPVYLYRYFLVSLPALVLLVAAGLARLGRVWLVVPAALVAVGLSTRTTVACTPGCLVRHDDWRGAAAYVEARTLPDDGIVFYPRELRTTFAHYLSEERRPRLLYPPRWPLEGGRVEGAATPGEALARARPSQRVWLVTWWLPEDGVPTLLAAGRGEPTLREFAGNVRVRLYGPVGS